MDRLSATLSISIEVKDEELKAVATKPEPGYYSGLSSPIVGLGGGLGLKGVRGTKDDMCLRKRRAAVYYIPTLPETREPIIKSMRMFSEGLDSSSLSTTLGLTLSSFPEGVSSPQLDPGDLEPLRVFEPVTVEIDSISTPGDPWKRSRPPSPSTPVTPLFAVTLTEMDSKRSPPFPSTCRGMFFGARKMVHTPSPKRKRMLAQVSEFARASASASERASTDVLSSSLTTDDIADQRAVDGLSKKKKRTDSDITDSKVFDDEIIEDVKSDAKLRSPVFLGTRSFGIGAEVDLHSEVLFRIPDAVRHLTGHLSPGSGRKKRSMSEPGIREAAVRRDIASRRSAQRRRRVTQDFNTHIEVFQLADIQCDELTDCGWFVTLQNDFAPFGFVNVDLRERRLVIVLREFRFRAAALASLESQLGTLPVSIDGSRVMPVVVHSSRSQVATFELSEEQSAQLTEKRVLQRLKEEVSVFASVCFDAEFKKLGVVYAETADREAAVDLLQKLLGPLGGDTMMEEDTMRAAADGLKADKIIYKFLLNDVQLKLLMDADYMAQIAMDFGYFGTLNVHNGELIITCKRRDLMKKAIGKLEHRVEVLWTREEIQDIMRNISAKTSEFKEADYDDDVKITETLNELGQHTKGSRLLRHDSSSSRFRWLLVKGDMVYWKATAGALPTKSSAVELSKLQRVQIGKGTGRHWAKAKLSDASHCFSVESTAVSLCLEADSAELANLWVVYLNALKKHMSLE